MGVVSQFFLKDSTHMISFKVNSKPASFEGDRNTPLLWVLRDHLKLTGAKFGCGIGQCGACTVHIDGQALRSCVMPISAIEGQSVTTIEGLASADGELHPVQKAWLEIDVPQCGYCQAGQIMATADFLKKHPRPSDQDIDKNMSNICRCGTYVRIRTAIHRAAELAASGE
jgi:isoquinoline 1-oxidoreductase alpha subunit